MSIFRTLKQRGYDPIRTIVAALTAYLTLGNYHRYLNQKPLQAAEVVQSL